MSHWQSNFADSPLQAILITFVAGSKDCIRLVNGDAYVHEYVVFCQACLLPV